MQRKGLWEKPVDMKEQDELQQSKDTDWPQMRPGLVSPVKKMSQLGADPSKDSMTLFIIIGGFAKAPLQLTLALPLRKVLSFFNRSETLEFWGWLVPVDTGKTQDFPQFPQ